MIRAGALYLAIVIALFIAIVSASLVMLAAHYRNNYLKNIRYQRLTENIESGVAYSLAELESFNGPVDIYGDGTDSLLFNKELWGIYELVELKSFINSDTLNRNFLMGKVADSLALYLSDEDRPLSISGDTRIYGNAQLPKSGLRQAYAEGKPYTGDKLIYNGKISDSGRDLHSINDKVLAELSEQLHYSSREKADSVINFASAFGQEAKRIYLGKEAKIENVTLTGKIIIKADSIIVIGASATLKDVQVYAPIIKIEKDFSGSGQLFASDSLIVGENAKLKYPSAVGIIRVSKSIDQPQIVVGKGALIEGVLFSFEKERTPMQTLISIAAQAKIKGEVFCKGFLKMEKGVEIDGKVACHRFIMRTSQTLYENFIIDVSLSVNARNRYYLSSSLFGVNKENKVLKWLN